jgi:hypothetical protein
MGLRRGGKAAEEEAAKSRPVFGRAEFFNIKNDGDSVIFRLLDGDQEWIYVKQHSYVPTKGAPPDADEKAKTDWPKRQGAVCRKDPAFKGIHSDCYICDHMKKDDGKSYRPTVRLWARVIIREAVQGTQAMVEQGQIRENQVGKTVGYRDLMVEEPEVDKDGNETGKTIRHPKIVVANMSVDNFFGALQGYAEAYADEGGILNRDFTVTRSGTGTDTTYKFAPRNPTLNFDLADPEVKAQYEIFAGQAHLSEEQLEKMVEDRASDDFYARYFDPTKPFPVSKAKKKDGEGSGSAAGAPVEQQAKPAEDPVTQEKLAAMRDRVRGGNRVPGDATPASTETPASEPAAAGAVNFGS